MHDAHHFLVNLSVVLCVAAVTTVVFQRLRQPVVLGYLLAGALISPHSPFPLYADEGTVHALSELGVILLMFSLGLEFSLRKLLKQAHTAALVAVIQCALMLWLGYVVGHEGQIQRAPAPDRAEFGVRRDGLAPGLEPSPFREARPGGCRHPLSPLLPTYSSRKV